MIFLDTNFFINLFVQENEDHERAMEIAEMIMDRKQIISNSVINEVISVLNMKIKLNKEEIRKIYDYLKNNFIIIEDTYLFDDALEKMVLYEDKMSFSDCIYISLMEDFEIKEIVSFDNYFDNKEGISRVY